MGAPATEHITRPARRPEHGTLSWVHSALYNSFSPPFSFPSRLPRASSALRHGTLPSPPSAACSRLEGLCLEGGDDRLCGGCSDANCSFGNPLKSVQVPPLPPLPYEVRVTHRLRQPQRWWRGRLYGARCWPNSTKRCPSSTRIPPSSRRAISRCPTLMRHQLMTSGRL